MQWILDHIETVLSLVAFLVAGWKARKSGALNTFLVKKVEGLADPADKEAIKAEAIAAGVQGVLGKVVANAGLSSKEKPAALAKKALQTLLPVFLGAVLLGGCGKSVEPYRLSVKGMVDTGNEVRPLVKTPLTPGEQALVDAWDFQRAAGQKLVDAGK